MPTRITQPARAALIATAALLAGQAAAQVTPAREPSPPVVTPAPHERPFITNAPPPPAPPPPPLIDRVITGQLWIDTPRPADYARFYPKAAGRAAVAGLATIKCVVRRDGRLADCTVTREDPVGFGFGDAAVRIARKFRMGPTDGNGDPVVGRKVVLPMHFKLADDTLPTPPH